MNYIEFEKNIKNKLVNDQIQFDVKQFMLDIEHKKNNKKYFFWLFGFAFLVSLGIGAYLSLESTSKISLTNISKEVPAKKIGLLAGNEMLNTDEPNVSTLKHSLVDNVATFEMTANDKEQRKASISGFNTLKNDINNFSQSSNSKSSEVLNSESPQEKSLPVGKSKIISSDNGMDAGDIEYKMLLAAPEILDIKHNLSNAEMKKKYLLMGNQIDCPDFGGSDSKSGLEIIAEVGVFNPMKSLSNTTNEADVITGLREANEKSKLGLRAGLFLKYRLKQSPFYVFGGADYSRTVEKMSLDYEVIERDTTIGVVSITQSQAGDTITYIYGEIYNETTRSGNKTRHYTISTIDIPIHVGYEVDFNRFSAGVELGAAFNLKSFVKGNFISSESEFSEIENTDYFKNRVGLRYDSRVVLGYKLNAFGKLYASLSFNSYPGSVSVASSGVKQRYNQLGLNLGYGMRF